MLHDGQNLSRQVQDNGVGVTVGEQASQRGESGAPKTSGVVDDQQVSPARLFGPGGDPYPAMYGKPDKAQLDQMVMQTATYFCEREEALLA